MREGWHNWLLAAAWMAMIFILSSRPQLPELERDWLDLVVKKLGHMVGYGVLAWLYMRALGSSERGGRRTRLVSWLLAVAYALTDEYHQTFVAGRNGSLVDVGIDAVGAGTAMLLQWWMSRRRGVVRRVPGVQ
ncbi:MAG: VanZ family protein [Chloroflexi bacterium]|nr:VanZ family protein [Chloroflexota bacterium]